MLLKAKFRLTSTTEEINGYDQQIPPSLTHTLRPVSPKGPSNPEGSEENQRFWEATPGGELLWTIFPSQREKLGDRFRLWGEYYVYAERSVDGTVPPGELAWMLGDVHLTPHGQLNVCWHPHAHSGRLQMNISRKETILTLAPALMEEYLAVVRQGIEHPRVAARSAVWRVWLENAEP